MTLAEYQTLTGITVPSSKQALVTAQINRVQQMLETMLGYTLNPDNVTQNLYNEQGKTAQECACPSVDTSTLQAPDAVNGAYRLYSYNPNDKKFHVDPFCRVFNVKLVKDGVTIKTFATTEYRVDYGQEGLSKYIENCQTSMCSCDCNDCIQLAVDASWLWQESDAIPSALQYVWADMVTYYANCKKDVKQESVGSHSYTKFDKATVEPELQRNNLAVIKRYAGPYGSVTPKVTV